MRTVGAACVVVLAGCVASTEAVPLPPNAFVSITAGYSYTCAIQVSGKAYCWGNNGTGQLGIGTTDPFDSVPRAVAGSLSFTEIDGGEHHTCGVSSARQLWCWGSSAYGEAGLTGGLSPTLVDSNLHFVTVSAGFSHSCGVSPAGTAYCWGHDYYGQLGDSDSTIRFSPVPVAGRHTFTSIVAAFQNSCGVTTGGAAYCWGYNFGSYLASMLGTGDTTAVAYRTPFPVAGGHVFRAVAEGGSYGCGLTVYGRAYCWGFNDGGTVGDSTTAKRAVPVPVVGNHEFTSIATGTRHACALAIDGSAWCWGADRFDELGSPPRGTDCLNSASQSTCTTYPVRVPSSVRFMALAVGDYHSCALDVTGQAYCWGLNAQGQGGVGTTDSVLAAPTPVVMPGR